MCCTWRALVNELRQFANSVMRARASRPGLGSVAVASVLMALAACAGEPVPATPAGSTVPVPGGYDVTGGGTDLRGADEQVQVGYQTRRGEFCFEGWGQRTAWGGGWGSCVPSATEEARFQTCLRFYEVILIGMSVLASPAALFTVTSTRYSPAGIVLSPNVIS